MELAGHSTPRAAMIYQHATKERGAEVAAAMSARLSKSSTNRLRDDLPERKNSPRSGTRMARAAKNDDQP